MASGRTRPPAGQIRPLRSRRRLPERALSTRRAATIRDGATCRSVPASPSPCRHSGPCGHRSPYDHRPDVLALPRRAVLHSRSAASRPARTSSAFAVQRSVQEPALLVVRSAEHRDARTDAHSMVRSSVRSASHAEPGPDARVGPTVPRYSDPRYAPGRRCANRSPARVHRCGTWVDRPSSHAGSAPGARSPSVARPVVQRARSRSVAHHPARRAR